MSYLILNSQVFCSLKSDQVHLTWYLGIRVNDLYICIVTEQWDILPDGEGSKYPEQKREQDLLKAKRQDDNFLWKKKIIKACTILDLDSTKASILWAFFSVTLEYLLAYRFIADRPSIFKCI